MSITSYLLKKIIYRLEEVDEKLLFLTADLSIEKIIKEEGEEVYLQQGNETR